MQNSAHTLKSPRASWYANMIEGDARVYSLWYLGALRQIDLLLMN